MPCPGQGRQCRDGIEKPGFRSHTAKIALQRKGLLVESPRPIIELTVDIGIARQPGNQPPFNTMKLIQRAVSGNQCLTLSIESERVQGVLKKPDLVCKLLAKSHRCVFCKDLQGIL